MLIRNLFFLLSVTLFAVASTVLDIFNYNPYKSNLSVFINFYTSFFIGLTGILSLIIYYTKLKIKKDKSIYAYFWPSVRQSALVSFSVTLLLMLKGLKLLDWWVGLPLVVSIILLELFFQTTSSNIKQQKKVKKD
jgi:asparagine N-glycosylation enzyme membrane subunit Stt3